MYIVHHTAQIDIALTNQHNTTKRYLPLLTDSPKMHGLRTS